MIHKRPVTSDDNDILLGRGSVVLFHPGNVRFRNIVKAHRNEYLAAGRERKHFVAEKVIRQVGGRFLKRDAEDRYYTEVDQQTVIEKVKQALREKPKTAPTSKGKLFSDLKKSLTFGKVETQEFKTPACLTKSPWPALPGTGAHLNTSIMSTLPTTSNTDPSFFAKMDAILAQQHTLPLSHFMEINNWKPLSLTTYPKTPAPPTSPVHKISKSATKSQAAGIPCRISPPSLELLAEPFFQVYQQEDYLHLYSHSKTVECPVKNRQQATYQRTLRELDTENEAHLQ